MRKFLFVLLAAFTIFSCQKKDTPNIPVEQDVVFGITEIDPTGGQKSTDDWICSNSTIDYAEVEIGGTTYYPLVFRLDGKLYTQAIKLTPGSYDVTRFLLKHDTDGDGPEIWSGDDEIVMGTPEFSSDYADYITDGLTVTRGISVGEFTKTEIDIEVLCFLVKNYDKFGFNWFAITEIVIREQCFFGDFCVKHPADYAGSNYEDQLGGLKIDMGAIMEIHVKDAGGNHVPGSPFTNASGIMGWGIGKALCVQYPDNLNIPGEVFTFDLYIYVANGPVPATPPTPGFGFKWFHTWTVTDDGMIDSNVPGFPQDDGVVDFVLGSCNLSGTDLPLAPYQNLPTSISMNIQHPGDPGYWDFNVISLSPAGNYDFGTGAFDGWCGDHETTIGEGTHTFDVYSSLYPLTWPTAYPTDWELTPENVNQVNWLFNHLGDWSLDITDLDKADGDKLQAAIWKILQDYGDGNEFSDAANITAHETYVPLPGGWAAVLMYTQNGERWQQLLFIQVDP